MFDAASASGSDASLDDDGDISDSSSDGSGEWVMLNGALAPAPEAGKRGPEAAAAAVGHGGRKMKKRLRVADESGDDSDDDFDADVFAPAEDYAEAIARDASAAEGGGWRRGGGANSRKGFQVPKDFHQAAAGQVGSDAVAIAAPAARIQRPRGGKRGKRAQRAAALRTAGDAGPGSGSGVGVSGLTSKSTLAPAPAAGGGVGERGGALSAGPDGKGLGKGLRKSVGSSKGAAKKSRRS